MSATLRSIFLVCRDLAASADFYRGLGFVQRKGSARTAVFDLGSAELHLHAELSEDEQEQFGVRWQRGSEGLVLSFQVENLEALMRRAPEGAVAVPPCTSAWGTRLAILKDPDGYRLEFQVPLGATL